MTKLVCSTLQHVDLQNTILVPRLKKIKNTFIEQFDFNAYELQIQGNETTPTEYFTKVTA